MKSKLFEHVGGNQFMIVKETEALGGNQPVNEMPVGDAKERRNRTDIRKMVFVDLLDILGAIGVKLNKKQELELFKQVAKKQTSSGYDEYWPPQPTIASPRGDG
jgi:hypothetical protein